MGAFPKGYSTYAEYWRHKHLVPWGNAGGGGGNPGPVIQPPFDTAHNAWSFDPDGIGSAQYVTGPTGTVTTPVKTQGGPSYYTYGATDRIDFGNALTASVWGLNNYTVYVCIAPTVADLAVSPTCCILTKDDGSAQRQFVLYLSSGVVNYAAFSAINGSAGSVFGSMSSALTAGRHVLALAVDLTQASGSRLKIYLDGSITTMGAETGTGSTQSSASSSMRLGQRSDATVGLSTGSYAYGYGVTHDPTTVANISGWLQTTKGWV